MANRGDAACLLGLAREAAAALPHSSPTELMRRAEAGFVLGDEEASEVRALTRVDIEAMACTRYACRLFRDVQNGPSPDWLREAVEAMGQRSISLLVDLTNYVMLELGQPLHAFDLDRLAERRIVVRHAREGESLRTLDGVERSLELHHMVIADADRPIAVAGVMGGEETEVSESTRWCLLESAHFDPTSVRRTRKELGLNTEASWRFERHVDPCGTAAALNRFAELYQEITGNAPVPGLIDERPAPFAAPALFVRLDRAERLLGCGIEPEEAIDRLQKLGFTVRRNGVRLNVEVPGWRADVRREEDLIEELGRALGYGRIPERLPEGSTAPGGLGPRESLFELLRQEALRCGFHQMMNHTLGAPHPLEEGGAAVRVRTPHSPEMAQLRRSLWPRLSDNLRQNGWSDLRLFEVGRVHRPDGERRRLALALTGRIEEPSWRQPKPEGAGFYELKGAVDRLLQAAGCAASYRPGSDSRLHPTRQAQIIAGGAVVGLIGEVHPDAALEVGWGAGLKKPEGAFCLAEIDLDALPEPATSVYRSVSRLPALGRDIAVAAPVELQFERIEAAARSAAGPDLESLRLFDVYQGPGVAEGWRSLALSLQWRSPDRTLTDEEGNQRRDAVASALESLGAKLR
jgi:phenylalanyl-tRNA synthetase beta chain